jgi:hypothetical protein
MAGALSFAALPATSSSAGGGTVAGKCGTITSISASNVQLSAAGGRYTASPLRINGNVSNCSIYLQSYWIDFDEPSNTTGSCKAAFSLFNALLLSSGASQGWSTSINVAPNGTASTAGCLGTHTVRAVLRSRTDGSVLNTKLVNYTVTLK